MSEVSSIQLRRVQPGDGIKADEWNALIDALQMAQVIPGSNMECIETTHGRIIAPKKVKKSASAGSSIKYFNWENEDGNTVTENTVWIGSNETEPWNKIAHGSFPINPETGNPDHTLAQNESLINAFFMNVVRPDPSNATLDIRFGEGEYSFYADTEGESKENIFQFDLLTGKLSFSDFAESNKIEFTVDADTSEASLWIKDDQNSGNNLKYKNGFLQIWNEAGDGYINLDMADVISSTCPAGTVIKFREIDVCVSGEIKKMLVLASPSY